MRSEAPATPDVYARGVGTAPTREQFETAAERPERLSLDTASLEPRRPRSHARQALRLTERHRQTVDLVMRARALRADQLRIALYPLGPRSEYSCQRCLTELYRGTYLDRLPRRWVNAPAVYLLTRRSIAGNRLLRARWGEDEWRRHLTRLGPLEHLLAINDVRVRLVRACHELGWTLQEWQRAEDLVPRLGQAELIPDAYFQVQRLVDGVMRTTAYFLEVERVGKSQRVLRSKLERYAQLCLGGGYAQAFGGGPLRLLVVFAGDERGVDARRVQVGVAAAARLGIPIARFAALDQLKAVSPVGTLTQALWHQPGHTAPQALVEVPGDR